MDSNNISVIRISRCYSFIAIGCENGDVILYDYKLASKIITCEYKDHDDVIEIFPYFHPPIRCMVISHSSTRIASCDPNGHITLWDVQNCIEMKSFENRINVFGYSPYNEITTIALSRDDRFIASAGGICSNIDQICPIIVIWDIYSGKKLGEFTDEETKTSIKSIDFSPDGTKIVSGSEDGRITIWNIYDKVLDVNCELYRIIIKDDYIYRNIVTVTPLPKHRCISSKLVIINEIVFSNNGKWLATASTKNSVIVWNVKNSSPEFILNSHEILSSNNKTSGTDIIRRVVFSKDDTRLASIHMVTDEIISSTLDSINHIIIWDTFSRNILKCISFNLLRYYPYSITFSNDLNCIVTVPLDSTQSFTRWDTMSEKEVDFIKSAIPISIICGRIRIPRDIIDLVLKFV